MNGSAYWRACLIALFAGVVLAVMACTATLTTDAADKAKSSSSSKIEA